MSRKPPKGTLPAGIQHQPWLIRLARVPNEPQANVMCHTGQNNIHPQTCALSVHSDSGKRSVYRRIYKASMKKTTETVSCHVAPSKVLSRLRQRFLRLHRAKSEKPSRGLRLFTSLQSLLL